MNELQLSRRLKEVAEYVPNGSSVADIGSDHAYLPCYLALHKKLHKAVAGEVNEGPFLSAKEQVEKLSLQSVISVRKGNGLEVMEPGEVEVITIAGMGGVLIATILEEGKDKLDGVQRLVLQPNVTADKVRIWLMNNGWALTKETILEEDNKIYEVLVADRGEAEELYEDNKELSILLGPYLMLERNEAFCKKWTYELENWRRILSQFKEAKQTEEVLQKKEELTSLIEKVEGVLKG
ncbi:tRNA (adenine(22)-N(1))-methyltransferase [Bacillus sp. FJAT-45350]|uniref:tRNA (adenine(22)-N(1))-methyltransferase n=1 Tax=Bacillus sp. FJAT-45350 TaxID=2011014 RepID=UPI000BB81EDF|nr:tRNA (adenine(22)-N(1))-methyltransferase TrmK [Bacillus sp. FJAT-45350]